MCPPMDIVENGNDGEDCRESGVQVKNKGVELEETGELDKIAVVKTVGFVDEVEVNGTENVKRTDEKRMSGRGATLGVARETAIDEYHDEDGKADEMDEMMMLGIASFSNSRAVSSTLCSSPSATTHDAAEDDLVSGAKEPPLHENQQQVVFKRPPAPHTAKIGTGAAADSSDFDNDYSQQNQSPMLAETTRIQSSGRFFGSVPSSGRLFSRKKSSTATNNEPASASTAPTSGSSAGGGGGGLLSSWFGTRPTSVKLGKVRENMLISVDPASLLQRFAIPNEPSTAMAISVTVLSFYESGGFSSSGGGVDFGVSLGRKDSISSVKRSGSVHGSLIRNMSSLMGSPATQSPTAKAVVAGAAVRTGQHTVCLKTVRVSGTKLLCVGMVRRMGRREDVEEEKEEKSDEKKAQVEREAGDGVGEEEDDESKYDEYDASSDLFDDDVFFDEDAEEVDDESDGEIEEGDLDEDDWEELVELAKESLVVALTESSVEIFEACNSRKVLETRLNAASSPPPQLQQQPQRAAQTPVVPSAASWKPPAHPNDPQKAWDEPVRSRNQNGKELEVEGKMSRETSGNSRQRRHELSPIIKDTGAEIDMQTETRQRPQQQQQNHQELQHKSGESAGSPRTEAACVGPGNPISCSSRAVCGTLCASGARGNQFDSLLAWFEDGTIRGYSLVGRAKMGTLRCWSQNEIDATSVCVMTSACCSRRSRSEPNAPDVVAIGCGDGQIRFIDAGRLRQVEPEIVNRVHAPAVFSSPSSPVMNAAFKSIAVVSVDCAPALSAARGSAAIGYSDGSVSRALLSTSNSINAKLRRVPVAHGGSKTTGVVGLAYGALIASISAVDCALVITHALHGTCVGRAHLPFSPTCLRRASCTPSTSGSDKIGAVSIARFSQIAALSLVGHDDKSHDNQSDRQARQVPSQRVVSVRGADHCVFVGGSQGEVEVYRITPVHEHRAEIRRVLRVRERSRGRDVGVCDIVYDRDLRLIVSASVDGAVRRWVLGTEHARLLGLLKCGVSDMTEKPAETRIGSLESVMSEQAKLADVLDPVVGLNADEMDQLVREFEAAQLEAQTAVTYADAALTQTRAALRAKYEFYVGQLRGKGEQGCDGTFGVKDSSGDGKKDEKEAHGESRGAEWLEERELCYAALEAFLHETRFATVQHTVVVDEVVRKLLLRLRKLITTVLAAVVARESEPTQALLDVVASFQATV